MLLSPSAPWPRIKPVRLNRPPQCKDRLSLHRGRRPRAQRRLGVCMAEMARIGSGSSREAGVSDGESDPILRAELPGPGREAVSWWTPVEAALNRMSKWLVAGSFAFAALWKHDAEIMWALMGAVVNTVLSSILKQMFNHERPAPALRSDPGMPSSHAQSIFYAATFLVLSFVVTGVAGPPHTESDHCGRYCRICLRRSVVAALAFACAGSVRFLIMGANYSHPWFSSVLHWLHHLHHSPLAQG
ncbi:uncharacterized protein LOC100838102 isoform X3 [Brachypodium distachyon]|uniref:uncharacterized protein LOC100838102 isoform X3 n=1 Tax=Brachypodium distachyon TaxID=15368 RepID=UPI000D0D29D1|nr:uncharacterized protein LOC100838102 isoform X3 [Brachypodium distachyon]|eukprot:XP_024317330.1 uncharacterized protein LOC100838102 isoform X3 [Brachypodium distachyon]